MTLVQQIAWGSAMLLLCLVIETVIIVLCAGVLQRHQTLIASHAKPHRYLATLMIAIGFVVFAHTIQIWTWSAAFMWPIGVFSSWNTAVYFSIATYTTLGYGDITLEPEFRIFATFAAMTGMLGFGISTAFLVGIMRPLLRGTLLQSDARADAELDS